MYSASQVLSATTFCFLEVDALALHESLGDEPRLVPHHLAALVPLHLEHPLEPNWPATGRRIHQLPRAVLLHRRHLLQHRRPPACLLFCCGEVWWLLCAAQMQLEVVQHMGRLPGRTPYANDVIHQTESEWLAGVIGVDVRGGARRRRDETVLVAAEIGVPCPAVEGVPCASLEGVPCALFEGAPCALLEGVPSASS